MWKVQIPNVSELKVTFTVFSVENNYDYLYYGVGQGEDTSRPIGQLTGNTLPDDIDFRVGVLWFRFTSDGSIQSNGFSFNWEATVCKLTPDLKVISILFNNIDEIAQESVISDRLVYSTNGSPHSIWDYKA